jgi:hypothetical protein
MYPAMIARRGERHMHKQLQEWLRPTPLGRTKLIAAWDELEVPMELEETARLR